MFCIPDVIDVADEGDCFSKLEAFEEGFEEEDEDPQPLSWLLGVKKYVQDFYVLVFLHAK